MLNSIKIDRVSVIAMLFGALIALFLKMYFDKISNSRAC